MNEQDVVTIPNTDFNNKAGLVTLTLIKEKGGYFLRENISGTRCIVGGFGQLGQILSGTATELLKFIQHVSDQCKDGEMFTIELQVRKGYPTLFGMAQGSGLLSIDNLGGWRPTNYFGQMMQQMAFTCGLAPEFLSQFPQSQEGWVRFSSHPNVANNPNLQKPIVSNFMNPFGNPGYGSDAFGMDKFAFIPTVNLDGPQNKNDGSVKERHHPDGSIDLG